MTMRRVYIKRRGEILLQRLQTHECRWVARDEAMIRDRMGREILHGYFALVLKD
jgi:hypothetical protein